MATKQIIDMESNSVLLFVYNLISYARIVRIEFEANVFEVRAEFVVPPSENLIMCYVDIQKICYYQIIFVIVVFSRHYLVSFFLYLENTPYNWNLLE